LWGRRWSACSIGLPVVLPVDLAAIDVLLADPALLGQVVAA